MRDLVQPHLVAHECTLPLLSVSGAVIVDDTQTVFAAHTECSPNLNSNQT